PAVASLVGDDPEQPRPERRTFTEAAERPVCLHEAVLGGLLGIRGVACDQAGGSEGDVLMHAHELLVCGGVPTLGLGDERCLVRWSAHHLALYTSEAPGVPIPRAG